MNDFLTNLLTRSSAETPAIRPRLPSLFESAAENFNKNHFAEYNLTGENKPVETGFLNSNPPPPSKKQPDDSTGNLSSPAPSKISPVENEIANAREPTAENPPQFFEKSEIKFVKGKSSLPKLKKPSPEIRPNPSAAREKLFSEQNLTRENQNASVRADSFSPKTSPTINITIGRVEVRAIQSAVTARKMVKPASPKLSLDDYLQKRDGGSR